MTKPQPVRKRTYKPKVRTGCVPCKARRIKCDESRPQCNACVRFDTPCHYQHVGPRLPTEPPRQILPAPTRPAPSLTIVPKSVFGRLATHDVRYLEFFVRGLQYQFSLSRIGDSALSNFWFRTVLQQGAQEEYILEGLLGIAALARARQSVPTRGPLYRHHLSHALKDENYRNALRHYDSAIRKVQQILPGAQPDARVGVILTSCILFFTFEYLQDNTSAVDAIGAASIEALPRLVSEGTPVDVKSVTEACYFLLRANVFQISFSPMYLSVRPRLLEITASESLQPPTALGPEKSTQEFLAMWWRFVTTVLNFTIYPATLRDESTTPKPWSRTPSLLAALDSWERAARHRATVCRDSDAIRLLQAVAVLAGRLSLALQARRVSTRTLESRDYAGEFPISPRDYSAILEFFKTSKKPPTDGAGNRSAEAFVINNEGAHDAALPTLLYVARRCPYYAIRLEALDLCFALLQPAPSLSLKATYMALRALAEIEGEELANCYAWTKGSWNDDYTGLRITLSPVDPEKHRIQAIHLILSTKDYGM